MVRPEQEHEAFDEVQEANPSRLDSSTEQAAASASRSRSRARTGGSGRQARGYSRNIDLDRYVDAHGRIRIEIDDNVEKPVCAAATKFSGAIGTITRATVPLRCASWKFVPREVRDNITDRLSTYFDFDMSKRVVRKYLERQMQNTFKEYRAELYQAYCEFENPTEARANPHARITNPEDWNLLCDRWETPEWKKKTETNKKSGSNLPYNHRAGKKSFIQLQSELKIKEGHDIDQVDLFHQSHFCVKDGWVNDKARDAYLEMQKLKEASSQEGSETMSGAEVCKKVLGHRSGHIRGLGWDPKPSSSSSVTSSSQHEKELEKKVEKMEGQMVQMQATNDALTTQLSVWEGRWADIQNLLGRQQGEDGPSNT